MESANKNLALVMDKPSEARECTKILIRILENCSSNVQIQQFVYATMQEILGIGSEFNEADAPAFGTRHAPLFTKDGKNLVDGPFVKALNTSDITVQKFASAAFATLLTVCDGNVGALIEWITNKLTSHDTSVYGMAMPALSSLMRRGSARDAFVAAGGVQSIVYIFKKLGSNGNAQQTYELTFILWTLSLNAAHQLNQFLSAGTIRILVEMVAAAPSRKVVRMAVCTLRNLAQTENDDVLTEMLTAGLDKLLGNMVASNVHKQSGDPEVEEAVKGLHEILLKNYRDLSTFERWTSEVQSRALRWGIVHTEKFWRENCKFVEQNDFKLLKQLIQLLHSDDKTVIAIALYDLGEFTRFYPNGRLVVSHLGGKDRAMELLSSDDEEIQTNALQCISKIMIHSWDLMR